MFSEINWENRMIGLTGPRGVGKTTLVLQYIRDTLPPDQTLYVTTEDIYFADNHLIDLAARFSKFGGKYLFIDEIHKYPDWSRELKLIYDYHPDLQVVFTGSSVLDIKKGAFDLSRRAAMYHMQGLSFREYLAFFEDIRLPKTTLEELLQHKVKHESLEYPLLHFSKYLKSGYYPFAADEDFKLKMRQILNQTLENDIPYFAGMNVSTGIKLKQLLSIIAKSVPFKPNYSKIANLLSVSRNNIADYFHYLEEAGLIAQLRNETAGIRGLGKVEKVFLDNTNLIYTLTEDNFNTGNLRETFFYNQIKNLFDVVMPKKGDFKINNITFEVGGKNKNAKQIKDLESAYLVKDDIEHSFGNIIPLWQFGFLY